MAQPEKQIQNAILDYLTTRKDVYCWQNSSQGVYDPRAKAFRKPGRHFVPGVADILGLFSAGPLSGCLLAIEVKTDKGRLTPHQEQFLETILKCGGIAFVARSITEVRTRLDQAQGIERPEQEDERKRAYGDQDKCRNNVGQ